jgi:hypothetical protein
MTNFQGWQTRLETALAKPWIRRGCCLALFLACLGRYWFGFNPVVHRFNSQEAVHLAHSFAWRGEIADPFRSGPTGPSAHVSPGYPVFAGTLLRWTGESGEGDRTLRRAAWVATAIQISILPFVTIALGIGVLPGVLAALCWIVADFPTYPDWEVSYASLLTVLATIVFLRIIKNPTTGGFLTLGCVLGLLLLFSSGALFVVASWQCAILWIWRRRLSPPVLAAIFLPFLLLAPWAIRNRQLLSAWIPLRSNLGLELFVSNHDGAEYSHHLNLKSQLFARLHPNLSPAEAAQVRDLGEVRYNSIRLEAAIRWIESHPLQFLTLTAKRIFYFWFPSEEGSLMTDLLAPRRRVERAAIYGATMLSIPGLILLRRRKQTPAFRVMISWMVLFPMVYYLVQFIDRYRAPILWATLIMAGYTGVTIFSRVTAYFAGDRKRLWQSPPNGSIT